jgi:hypothetical protein
MNLTEANREADRINETTEHAALIIGNHKDGYRVQVWSTKADGGLIRTI